jgi:hypothetical protein
MFAGYFLQVTTDKFCYKMNDSKFVKFYLWWQMSFRVWNLVIKKIHLGPHAVLTSIEFQLVGRWRSGRWCDYRPAQAKKLVRLYLNKTSWVWWWHTPETLSKKKKPKKIKKTKKQNLKQKRAGGMVQVVEHLTRKYKVLSLNPIQYCQKNCVKKF